jgi:hypothetical protein
MTLQRESSTEVWRFCELSFSLIRSFSGILASDLHASADAYIPNHQLVALLLGSDCQQEKSRSKREKRD